jgi:hypothetical protein
MVRYVCRETSMAGQLESLDRGFECRLCYACLRKLIGGTTCVPVHPASTEHRVSFPGDQAAGS